MHALYHIEPLSAAILGKALSVAYHDGFCAYIENALSVLYEICWVVKNWLEDEARRRS